jgi:Type VI secretion system/phage-baseplate injector OB domain
MTTDTFHGLYQGVVVSNVDPLNRGRLLVTVSDVLDGFPTIWAEPSTPLAGLSSGMYVVPLPNSGVWVEFAGGDPERAVWTGFWRGGTTEIPNAAKAIPPGTPQIVLGTPTQNSIVITDLPGPTGGIQIQLHGPAGPYIKVNETGIELSCGPGLASIRLTGTSVIVNNGALIVT